MTQNLGYVKEGRPTDDQVELQDAIDNEIQQFLGNIQELYGEGTDDSTQVLKWDIHKISRVRELAEELLELPDIY